MMGTGSLISIPCFCELWQIKRVHWHELLFIICMAGDFAQRYLC